MVPVSKEKPPLNSAGHTKTLGCSCDAITAEACAADGLFQQNRFDTGFCDRRLILSEVPVRRADSVSQVNGALDGNPTWLLIDDQDDRGVHNRRDSILEGERPRSTVRQLHDMERPG